MYHVTGKFFTTLASGGGSVKKFVFLIKNNSFLVRIKILQILSKMSIIPETNKSKGD